MMQIRTASAEEMLALWGYQSPANASPTAQFFYQNIRAGNAVFWTIENDNALIGELYGFLNLTDTDFADGTSTAYLCAFRVKDGFRGQGLGSRLLETALAELKRRGFRQATIGVSPDEPQNVRLYRRHGFLRKIKDCHYDPCGMDAAGQPDYDPKGWWLLAKELRENAT